MSVGCCKMSVGCCEIVGCCEMSVGCCEICQSGVVRCLLGVVRYVSRVL